VFVPVLQTSERASETAQKVSDQTQKTAEETKATLSDKAQQVRGAPCDRVRDLPASSSS